MVLKKIKAITKDKDENYTFNIASTVANANWLISTRMIKQGKRKEVEKSGKEQLYILNE